MADKCLIFVYGLLSPELPNTPRTAAQAWVDRIPGSLSQVDDHLVAVDVGKLSAGWIDGHTLEIDVDELMEIDAFEDVESGEFRRVTVETASGHLAWVYEYCGASLREPTSKIESDL